ncbi:glycosyltransferase family 4 protein [Neptuniibacter pectenicola]|uniref:glycosyltransferase family 4 protein n=1 Tax=Neptuniibacter pectenicola TaxID=1806669 RepID=UPI00082B312F|nr:glycosyltransferase family 4 protein [Neptuniibacter pectenicola]
MNFFITFGDHKDPKNGGAKFTAAFISLAESANVSLNIFNYYENNGSRNKLYRKVLSLFYFIFKKIPVPVGYFYSYRLLSVLNEKIIDALDKKQNVTLVIDHLELCYIASYFSDLYPGSIRYIHLSHNNEPLVFNERIGSKFLLKVINFISDYGSYEKKVLNKMDFIFSISNTEMELYKKRYPELDMAVLPPLFSYKVKEKNEHDSINKKIVFAADFSWFPNMDAYIWVRDVFLPLLPKGFTIYIYGLNQDLLVPPVKELEHKIEYCGYVDDVQDIWDKAFFSIAPINKGAGINIKVAESLHNRVPVIASELAVEGIDESMLGGVRQASLNPEEWIGILEYYLSNSEYCDLVDEISYPSLESYIKLLAQKVN